MGNIGTVDVALLVLAVTQGVKALFGVEGKANQAIAFGVAFVLVAISHGTQQELIPSEWIPFIEWFVKALSGALAAIGVFEFGKRGVRLYRVTNGK
jgi:hypothetical protein